MGDLADDINGVFSLQSSVYKAIEMVAERTDPDQSTEDVMIPPWVLQQAEGIVFMWTYKVGMFLSFSAGNGLVMRKRRGPGNESRWSLPSAIAFGGAGGGFDFGAACSSVIIVLNTREAVEHYSGSHVKLSLDAQACAGPAGRAVEGSVNVKVTEQMDNVVASQCYAYGTSEGLFAGAGAHATWIAAKDDQNEEYYRRPMSAAEILSTFGHDAGEMGRRHEEIFRLHEALEAAERGAGGGAYERSRSAFNKAGSAEARGTPF